MHDAPRTRTRPTPGDDGPAAARWHVRRATVGDAAHAVATLREAAGWSARFGPPVWDPGSFTVADYRAFAEAGELVVGVDGGWRVACMLLQRNDPVYWPADPPGCALYLHKLAVRRVAAGCGWSRHLIDWAVAQARRAGAEALRLDTLPDGRLPALYDALGFRRVDEGPRWFAGRWVLRMERRL